MDETSKKMSVEDYLRFVTGQILVLKKICGTLIATHPMNKELLALIKGIEKYPIEGPSSGPYIDGIKDITGSLEDLRDLAVLAEQSALQTPGKKN